MSLLGTIGKWAAITAVWGAYDRANKKEAEEKVRQEKTDRDLNFVQLWDLSEKESLGLCRAISEPCGVICKCRFVTDEWYSTEITKEVFWDEDEKPFIKYSGKFLYIDIAKATPKGCIPEVFWAQDVDRAILKYAHAESVHRNRFVYDPLGYSKR